MDCRRTICLVRSDSFARPHFVLESDDDDEGHIFNGPVANEGAFDASHTVRIFVEALRRSEGGLRPIVPLHRRFKYLTIHLRCRVGSNGEGPSL